MVIKTKLQDKFQTVLCYEGFIDTQSVMSLIQSVLLSCESEIAQAAELTAMRALQSEQDAAYLRSLEIDKEKLRKRNTNDNNNTYNIDSNNIYNIDNNNTYNIDNNDTYNIDNNDNNINESISMKTSLLMGRIEKAKSDCENEPEDGIIYKFQFLFPDGTRKIRKFSPESSSKVKTIIVYSIHVFFSHCLILFLHQMSR